MAARQGSARPESSRMRLLPQGVGAFIGRRLIEIFGLVTMLLGVAILVANIGHNPADPSLNRAANTAISNPLGLPGAYLSDLMLQSLGAGAYLLGPVIITWGWRIFRNHGLRRWWLRLCLLPLCLLSFGVVMSCLPTPETWGLRAGLGGFAGQLLHHHIGRISGLESEIIGAITAVIFLAALVPVIALSRQEWTSMGSGVRALLGGAGGHAGTAARHAGGLAGSATGGFIGFLSLLRRKRKGDPDEDDDDSIDLRPGRLHAEIPEPRKRRRKEPRLDKARRKTTDDNEDLVTVPKPTRASGKRARREAQGRLSLGDVGYELPPIAILSEPPETAIDDTKTKDALEKNARLLETVLQDFGVRGEIVKVRPGPVVTRYDLEPAPGTKTSRVVSLADDIARSMSAISVRVAVVPGSSAIGIELPNAQRETVFLRELLDCKAFDHAKGNLPVILGKDIGGEPSITDLAKMPHLLVAGTTGSGKSVGLNAMILSLLYRMPPERCKMIMIDPKMLELSVYDGIPHLLSPVVTEPRKAVVALKWAVREMENRYRAMSLLGVRNIDGYNSRIEEARKSGEVLTRRVQTGFDPDTGQPVFEEQPFDLEPLPFIVVIVDEMADLMMVAGKDVEAAIQRLAQMARAAGLHLIMATQRPSVDVITGTIKANFPTRISFHVTSKIDSRTILGESGAEHLLGMGDMLYMGQGGRLQRVHGPFVSDREVEEVVAFLKTQAQPSYKDEVTEDLEGDFTGDTGGGDTGGFGGGNAGGGSGDALFDQAVDLVSRHRKASTSFIQRQLQIGYNRAARIIERMEEEGMVSTANHVGKREVLLPEQEE